MTDVKMMPFKIITDHASLKWLMSLKDFSGRLAKCSLQLQGFNFEIEHEKDSENMVADMLSRLDIGEISKSDLLDFETMQFDSEEYQELKNAI